MGAAFPSSRAASQAAQGINFRIADLLKGRSDQSLSQIQSIKLGNLQSAINRGLSGPEAFKQFTAPLPFEVAQQKAEQQFKQTQAKAESDFLSKIKSAIDKQLSAFTIPTATAQQPIIQQPIIQTPMIESESQIKQEFQSPVSLIPIAIIGIILGVVLLGKN